KQLSDGIEQVLREAAALEDRPHEREERDREQEVIRDDAEQLIGQVAEKIRADETELDPDDTKEQASECKAECGGIDDQHENDHAREHQRSHVVADQSDHCSGFSYSYCK